MGEGPHMNGDGLRSGSRPIRLGRGAFWLILVFTGLAGVVVLAVSGMLLEVVGDWGMAPFLVFGVAAIVILVVASIGRVNDIGWNSKWVLLYLIPVAGLLLLVPLLILRSESAAVERPSRRADAQVASRRKTRNTSLAPLLVAALDASQRVRDLQRSVPTGREGVETLSASLRTAQSRLDELESGRGALVATVAAVQLYEFWLDLPGYSGPGNGATARLSESGNVYSVSDVTGNTKGGLGGAVVGGLVAGPVGAIVGSNVRRKTTVETKTRTVDTRKYDLEILGPGFAYSIQRSTPEELRRFRDLINARGSSGQTAESLVVSQRELVKQATDQVESAQGEYARIDSMLREAQKHSARLAGECRAACESTSDRLRVWWVMHRLPGSKALLGDADQRLDVAQSTPGWHADPTNRHEYRYWDGDSWSPHVSDAGKVSIDALEA